MLIDRLFNGILSGLWTTAKNTGRGAVGKSGGYVQDVVNHAKQTGTGYRYDSKGNVKRGQKVLPENPTPDDIRRYAKEKPLTGGHKAMNRFKGATGILSDLTFGAAGQALGWGIHGTAKAGVVGAKVLGTTSVPLIKGAGQATSQLADLGLNTAGFAVDAMKNPVGRMALFSTPLVGAGLYGATKEGLGSNYINEGIQLAVGSGGEQYTHSIAGSVTAPARQRRPDNFGADGDLVFAMHNLR